MPDPPQTLQTSQTPQTSQAPQPSSYRCAVFVAFGVSDDAAISSWRRCLHGFGKCQMKVHSQPSLCKARMLPLSSKQLHHSLPAVSPAWMASSAAAIIKPNSASFMSLSWRRYCHRAELMIKFGTDEDVITDTNDTHEPNICSNTLCNTPAAWIPKHRLVTGVRVPTSTTPPTTTASF